MWPWEHLAFGYVLYSVAVHVRRCQPPTDVAVLTLAVATQFPDVVDKSVAWVFGLVEHGRLAFHSLFVVVPLLATVLTVTVLYDRTELGVAAAVGYLSHLVGDSVYGVFFGGDVDTGFLLWPLVERPEDPLVEGFGDVFATLTELLTSPETGTFLKLEATLLTAAFLLWVYDGVPTLRYVVPGRQARPND